MPNRSQMIIEFPADTLSRLDEIARLQSRSGKEIVEEAVNSYLDSMSWFENEVQKGLEDSKAGRMVSHEEVKEKYKRLGIDVD